MVLTEQEKILVSKFRRVVKYAQGEKKQSGLEILIYPGGENCKLREVFDEKLHLEKLTTIVGKPS